MYELISMIQCMTWQKNNMCMETGSNIYFQENIVVL